MGFNNKSPRWIGMRADRLGKKWRDGETACQYCGKEMWFTDYETIREFYDRAGRKVSHKAAVATLDHVVPISRGGPHKHQNLTTMCITCNVDKGNRDPGEWISERSDAGGVSTQIEARFRKKIRRAIRICKKQHQRKRKLHDKR